MARLIDAEGIKYTTFIASKGNGMYENVDIVGKDAIDMMPTIDAVPVIRCKDCKEMLIGARGDRLCWLLDCLEVKEDDFCCWAKRKGTHGTGNC